MAAPVPPSGLKEAVDFIAITPPKAMVLVGLGFVGGLLSGFFGTGGAFIMTPGMMGLGVPGIAAVGANITHKFGKALVGAFKHREMGNVDVRLVLSMFIALFAGTQLAVSINKGIFKAMGEAGSNLYISICYVLLLTAVAYYMGKDLRRNGKVRQRTNQTGPTLLDRIYNLKLPPVVNYRVANTTVSLWLVLLVGLLTGYLAGTIGIGGFVGVPAMIYLLRVRAVIAAGTELGMAIFSGAYGAFSYALGGFVDLRLVLLLYLGSLVGIQIGAIATKAVKEAQIKMVIVLVVAIVAVSRALAVPAYLSDLGYLALSTGARGFLLSASNIFLYGSATAGAILILVWFFQALTGARASNAWESDLVVHP